MMKSEHGVDSRGCIIAAHQEQPARRRSLQQSECNKKDHTYKSFFAVRRCSGVLREPDSGEGMILSCSRRVAVLEVPAAPCFDIKSFLVITAGRAVTTATWGDGGKLYAVHSRRSVQGRARPGGKVKARRGDALKAVGMREKRESHQAKSA